MTCDGVIDRDFQGQRNKQADRTRERAQQEDAEQLQPVWPGLTNDPPVQVELCNNVTFLGSLGIRASQITEMPFHSNPGKLLKVGNHLNSSPSFGPEHL